jgi:hypothetical protein
MTASPQKASPKKASPKKASPKASPKKASPKKASPKKVSTKVSKKDSKKEKKVTKKDAKADKPKRAPSAFIKFSNAKRGEVKAANPEFKLGDIGKALGALWNKLTAEEKAKFA